MYSGTSKNSRPIQATTTAEKLEAEQVTQRVGLLLQKGKQNLKASLFSGELRRKVRLHILLLGTQIYGTTGPRKALSKLALGHLWRWCVHRWAVSRYNIIREFHFGATKSLPRTEAGPCLSLPYILAKYWSEKGLPVIWICAFNYSNIHVYKSKSSYFTFIISYFSPTLFLKSEFKVVPEDILQKAGLEGRYLGFSIRPQKKTKPKEFGWTVSSSK